MNRQLYRVCAALIILLVVVSVFLFVQHDLAEREQLEKELAVANKMLAAQEQSKKVLDGSETSVRPPPPGESVESGHWDGNVWHKTGPSESESKQENNNQSESASPFSGVVDQLALAERIIAERPYSDDAAEARTILLYEHRENYDKAGAVAYLQDALEYHPESSLILSDLGMELWYDNPEEAIPYLQKALSVANPDGIAYLHLGHAYERLGDYKTAWVYYKTGQRVVDMHPLDPFAEKILAIEAGSPQITPISLEAPVSSFGDPLPSKSSVPKDKSVLPEPSKSDDFFFPEKPSDVPQPQEFVPPSELDRRGTAERAFSEMQQRSEQFHIDDELARQELDVFIEWAQTLMNDAPLDTNNFLAKELSAHLRGKETTFAPQRITRAFEIMERHGQNEGMKRLQKNDPELAKEVQRLLSEKREAPDAQRIHNK
ncbi:MAG: hypothetical protein OXM61_24570 [Candidatus Poribacteria bacterium]|nr:hypothetical protein [Candidatus Poribacteria bacterium]